MELSKRYLSPEHEKLRQEVFTLGKEIEKISKEDLIAANYLDLVKVRLEREKLLRNLEKEADTKSLILAHYLKQSKPQEFRFIKLKLGQGDALTHLILATPPNGVGGHKGTLQEIQRQLPELTKIFNQVGFQPGNLLKINAFGGYQLLVFWNPDTNLISYTSDRMLKDFAALPDFKERMSDLGLTEKSLKYLYS